MADVLVRGLPDKIHKQIQVMARERNLSINQTLVHLLRIALTRMEQETKEQGEREEIFARAERLRKEIARKYGRFDDSWKLIREDRDSH